jgi:membrane-associated phospholipid phosphatase
VAYLPWGIAIVVSTVFLREHYVVDLLAGAALGAWGLLLCGTVSWRERASRS